MEEGLQWPGLHRPPWCRLPAPPQAGRLLLFGERSSEERLWMEQAPSRPSSPLSCGHPLNKGPPATCARCFAGSGTRPRAASVPLSPTLRPSS